VDDLAGISILYSEILIVLKFITPATTTDAARNIREGNPYSLILSLCSFPEGIILKIKLIRRKISNNRTKRKR
jgi:hypothetical protein